MEIVCFYFLVHEQLGSELKVSLNIAYVVNDILFIISGLSVVCKIHSSRTYFTDLLTDCLLSDMTSECDGTSVKRFEVAASMTYTTVFVVRLASEVQKEEVSVESIVYILGMALLYIPTLLQIVMVQHLKSRFISINTHLREIFEVMRDNVPLNDVRADLASVFRRHLLLRNATSRINSYFGLGNVVMTGDRILFLMIVMYNLLTLIGSDPTQAVSGITVFVLMSVVLVIWGQCDGCFTCAQQVNNHFTFSVTNKYSFQTSYPYYRS